MVLRTPPPAHTAARPARPPAAYGALPAPPEPENGPPRDRTPEFPSKSHHIDHSGCPFLLPGSKRQFESIAQYSLAVAQALAHSALLQFGERAAAVALSKSAWGSGRDPGSNAHEEAALGKVPLTLYQTVDEKTARRPEVGSDPGLRYVLHDDASGFEYLNHSWGPRFANAFAKPRAFAIRSDFLRLCYIAEHGGFYSDADVCPVHREVLSRMQQTRAPLILVQSMATGGGAQRLPWCSASPPRPATACVGASSS